VLIVGGGAVCFSFGVHWNEGTWLLQDATSQISNEWHSTEASAAYEDPPSGANIESAEGLSTETVSISTMPRISIYSSREFEVIVNKAKPVILHGLDIGPCKELWTKAYLEKAIGRDRNVSHLEPVRGI
jgi:tRNA wybutosine-synthesizing protein 4